jgi:hypothetical protein
MSSVKDQMSIRPLERNAALVAGFIGGVPVFPQARRWRILFTGREAAWRR